MTDSSSKLMTRREAAEYLGLIKETLDNWASTKRYDLPFIKVGKLCKYRKEDLDAFLDKRTVRRR